MSTPVLDHRSSLSHPRDFVPRKGKGNSDIVFLFDLIATSLQGSRER